MNPTEILAAHGWLEPARLLRERFGAKMIYLQTTTSWGNPISNGCDLSKPGIVPIPYLKPAVKKRG